MLTTKEKRQKIDKVIIDHIDTYHLREAKKEIRKGNENVKVLYDLLLKEINALNGIVKKKIRKIEMMPTSD